MQSHEATSHRNCLPSDAELWRHALRTFAITNRVESSSLRSIQLLLLCHHTTVHYHALITGPSRDALGIRLGTQEREETRRQRNSSKTFSLPLPILVCHPTGVRGATRGLGASDEARTRLDFQHEYKSATFPTTALLFLNLAAPHSLTSRTTHSKTSTNTPSLRAVTYHRITKSIQPHHA